MPENQPLRPLPLDAETGGALTQVVSHEEGQQQHIFFGPDAAEKIRRLVEASGIVESALHD